MTYAQERMIFWSQSIHFLMRRAKKAVKYKVNPDGWESSPDFFSSPMETCTYWLNTIADNSSIVGEEMMHSTLSYIHI